MLKAQEFNFLNKLTQEYQPPFCQIHSEEKIVRICTSLNCPKYFEIACTECLDQHNHNIQDMLKFKDFLQILEKQSISGDQNCLENFISSEFQKNQCNNLQQQQNKTQAAQMDDNEDEFQIQKNNKNSQQIAGGILQQQQQSNQKAVLSDAEVQEINMMHDFEIITNEDDYEIQQNSKNFNQNKNNNIINEVKDLQQKMEQQQFLQNSKENKSPGQNFQKKEQSMDANNKQKNEKKQQNDSHIIIIGKLKQMLGDFRNKIDVVELQLSEAQQQIERELVISPQSQVREILKEILIKNNKKYDQLDQEFENEIINNDYDEKEDEQKQQESQNLYKNIPLLKPFMIKSSNIQIIQSQKSLLLRNISKFQQAFQGQLQKIEKEFNNLMMMNFQQFNSNSMVQEMTFTNELKGKQPVLNFSDKGVIQKGNEDRFVLMEPKIDIDIKTRWALRILDVGSWTGVGIANKQVIMKENFQFTKYTGNGKHGGFLVSNNGYSWNYKQPKLNMQINKFQFMSGDVLMLEYNPDLKKVVVICERSRKIALIDVSVLDEGDEYFACINMCTGANVRIIENFKWPDRSELLEYTEVSGEPVETIFIQE